MRALGLALGAGLVISACAGAEATTNPHRAAGATALPVVARACVPADAAHPRSRLGRTFTSSCDAWLGWFRQPLVKRGPFKSQRFKRIGAVAYAQIVRQADSNLRVLGRALHGHVLRSAVIRVPLGNRRHYALAFWIDLAGAGVLRGHPGRLADLQDGLETGLTGSPNTLIEGESIEVYAGSAPLLGAWTAYHRGVSGTLTFSPRLGHIPCNYSETAGFPDLTHGPHAASTVISCPVTLSRH